MSWLLIIYLTSAVSTLLVLGGIVGYVLGERKGENTIYRLWRSVNVYKDNTRKSI